MRNTQLVAILTVLTLLVIACAPAKMQAPPAAPEAQPASNATAAAPAENATATSEAAPEAKPAGRAPIAQGMTADQQKALKDLLANIKGEHTVLGQAITALQQAAQQKNDAALTKDVQALQKLYAATTPVLDRLDAAIGTNTMVDDAVRAREQLDAMIILTSNTQQDAAKLNDPDFFALLDDAAEVLTQEAEDYHFGFLGELGQDTAATPEQVAASEQKVDQELVKDYGVAQADLDSVQEMVEAPPEATQ